MTSISSANVNNAAPHRQQSHRSKFSVEPSSKLGKSFLAAIATGHRDREFRSGFVCRLAKVDPSQAALFLEFEAQVFLSFRRSERRRAKISAREQKKRVEVQEEGEECSCWADTFGGKRLIKAAKIQADVRGKSCRGPMTLLGKWLEKRIE